MAAGHILTYARTLSRGGVERAQLRLIAGWLAAGRRVTLVIGDRGGPDAPALPPGLETVDLHDRRYLRLVAALPQIVRAARPDILFCAGNYYTGVAAWTKLVLRDACPPIVGKMSNAVDRSDHGRLFALGHRAWLALHGRFLDSLVAMTPATAGVAADALRMRGRVSVIPNPPVAPRADPAVPETPPGRFVLGVGRLVAQKRWDRLIASLPALPADVSLLILGEGPLRGRLLAQAARLGLGGRVALPGNVADPLPTMARATMLALVSDFEGVPGVLREALSVGTPVVTTDSTDAVHEIVSTPALGSIVPRDDPAALVAALTGRLNGPRPDPVPQPGADAALRYLALFDTLA